MLQFGTRLFIFFTLGVVLSSAQWDPDYCPDGPTTGAPDPRWRFSTDRFEIITELISSGSIGELSQAFSSTRDSIALNIEKLPLLLYWNFVTNEQFQILTTVRNNQTERVCFREPIQISSATSVILNGALYLKPSVLLGFTAQNKKNLNWSVRYIGNHTSRSLPALTFQSCFNVPDIQATAAVTFQTLDEQQVPVPTADNQVVLLQMTVNILAKDGKKENYIYNVFRFVPNPSRREERQALETPSGVYCAGRDLGLAVPANLPERLSSNSEVAVPELNAAIFSSHGLYDTEAQATHFEYWLPSFSDASNWQHLSGIHDFSVGLSYIYDYGTRQCNVTKIPLNSTDAVSIDGSPNLLQIGTPQHFFRMDDIQYQYTGEKPCRDRYFCHVWIGEKVISPTEVEHREWFWAFSMNDQPLARWIPMKYFQKNTANGVVQSSYEITVFNYRQNPFTIFELDYTLAECYRALGPTNNYNLAVLSFKINNDKNYPVMSNLNYLRLHIWETLLFTLFIRPIRLSTLVVDQIETDIVVTFTLLDAPPEQGPVENPINETSSDELITRLDNIINANGLAFRARSGDKQIVLRTQPNSLNVIHKSSTIETVSSGARITTFWIVFIVVGIIVGLVGGFVIMKFLTAN